MYVCGLKINSVSLEFNEHEGITEYHRYWCVLKIEPLFEIKKMNVFTEMLEVWEMEEIQKWGKA